MRYEQQIAEQADRYWSSVEHKFFRDRTTREQQERDEWVQTRTEAIVDDDDYFPDLIQTLLESSAGINALLHVKKAKFADLLGANAHFHEYLTKVARNIAESEAKRRFGF